MTGDDVMKNLSQLSPRSGTADSFEGNGTKEGNSIEEREVPEGILAPEGILNVPIFRLPHAKDLPLPERATPNSSGFDLQAAIASALPLHPRKRMKIPTGFSMALPPGFEGQIRPRSGLAHNHGITVLNTPGTIDADYRGEISILLIHHGDDTFMITPGMRIAQLVIAPIARTTWHLRPMLDHTERGEGGFGSTGLETTCPHPS